MSNNDNTKKVLYGINAAPPLPKEKVPVYREMGRALEPRLREPFMRLCDMVELFYETPASTADGVPHPLAPDRAVIVPLTEDEKARMWDAIPWPDELDLYGQLFDAIDNASQHDLRNAAYHLLWFARELDLDREPITTDKILAR